MKSNKVFFACFILIFFIAEKAISQNQMFNVHEDRVHPSKVAKYEKACLKLNQLMKASGITEIDYFSANTDDFRYFHLTPIKSLGDVEQLEAILVEKIGKAAFGKLMQEFQDCYKEHGDYVIILDEELSYMPEGLDITTPGQNYREFTYWYYTPANEAKLETIAKEYKAMCERKNAKMYYRIYRAGYGTMEPFFLVVSSAQNALDYETQRVATIELLGEERKALFQKALLVAERLEISTGQTRPDISYFAKK